jgi:hypothetical protein
VSVKGQFIRAKKIPICGNMFNLPIGPLRIIKQKKWFLTFAPDDKISSHQSTIYELEYLRKLKRNTRLTFFCCSVWLFSTFWPKMSKICVVLPEIFSKNLYFDRFSWIFCLTVGPKIVSIMFSLSTDWPKYLRNAKNLQLRCLWRWHPGSAK